MAQALGLTLEQGFNLRNSTDLVQRRFREQAKKALIEQYKIMMVRKASYQELLRQEWKLDESCLFLGRGITDFSPSTIELFSTLTKLGAMIDGKLYKSNSFF